MNHINKILIDECCLYIGTKYRKSLEEAGFEVYELKKQETAPLNLSVSDIDIFNWVKSQKDEIAIITSNRKDFLSLNKKKEVTLLLIKGRTISETDLLQALTYINKKPKGYKIYSIPNILRELEQCQTLPKSI